MNVLELQTALAPVVLLNPAAPVVIRASSNLVLNLVLKDGTVLDTVTDTDGNFVLNLAPIAIVFRIGAPYDTALDERLDMSNILGAFKDVNTGEFVFLIDT